MDEFQDLPIQFGQVLKAKKFSWCCTYFAGKAEPWHPSLHEKKKKKELVMFENISKAVTDPCVTLNRN